jgi:predicted regulator of Ras-like GTPase activity (Roadblock/LC7/MglB family)
MDAAQALGELMELSSQVEAAVVLGSDGAVVAASPEGERADALAAAALELVGAAFDLGARQEVLRVEVELGEGAVFVLREGGRTIAARTVPEPASGLVVYDLRTCLRSIADEPKKRRGAKKEREDAGKEGSE